MRKTALELGSISCTAIAQDASLTPAMFANCANAAFRKAGQVCTSIQRLYLQRDIEQEATEGFLKATAALRVGDPAESGTVVGPMISLAAAERVEGVDQARRWRPGRRS